MTRLTWHQIRINAATFAREWQNAAYERGETQSFYNDFFEVFGVKRRRVASFEEPVRKLGEKRGYIDLFWKGVLLVEQKSAGRNLALAKQQALDYFPGLKEYELPRYILICDFQHFELYDLDENTTIAFSLPELPHYVEAFGFILGIQKRTFRDQDPVNIQASELMGRLHDSLKAAGYGGRDLERLLVRRLAQKVLDARAAFPEASLADLYDALLMPPALRQAHRALDSAVERLYRVKPFADDRERVEHLLALYEMMITPLLGGIGRKKRRT